MEQDKLLKVDKTIEKLCDFLQRETERVASIYESQELAEMAKALDELMSARAKFNQFRRRKMKEYEFWILWLMSIVMQLQIQIINKRLEIIKQSYNITGKKIEWQMQRKSQEVKGYGAEMLSTECN